MIVDCAVYEQGVRRTGTLPLEQAYNACHANEDAWVWIGLSEPTQEEFDSVTREFQLHELAVEDAIKAHQRPKLEDYEGVLFLVLKTARYIDEEESVEFGEILIFVGDGFIITVRHGEASALHSVRLIAEERPELLERGPGAALHAIIDRVVDDYTPVAAGIENDIEEVEAAVFSPQRESAAERIYKLKREVLEFHRATSNLLDPLDQLAGGDYELLHEETHQFFRDVHDHALRVNEQVEGFRDLLSSVLTANLTQVSVRQNEDMRRISAWVAIIAVPTAIAGIYGMNFEHMPELKWELGYPAALLVMASICTGLYRYFKKVGWL
jgi:magnesium transporter